MQQAQPSQENRSKVITVAGKEKYGEFGFVKSGSSLELYTVNVRLQVALEDKITVVSLNVANATKGIVVLLCAFKTKLVVVIFNNLVL